MNTDGEKTRATALERGDGLRRALSLAIALVASACGGPTLHVAVRPEVPAVTAGTLRAAVSEVDLTPPPGAPLFGYALLSASTAARGYRTRLKARVVVLEGPRGGRFALVQADLGAPSRLLHQLVASHVADLGLAPDRIILAATHTHAAPGGYFENGFYNDFGAGWIGFDPELTGFLASGIAHAITEAVYHLAPAKIGVESVHVPFVTENRSPEAFRENHCPGCGGVRIPEVNDRLTLLRVDRVVGSGTEPLGAFVVFAVHGTAVSEENQLYHGDVLGYASRRFASLVKEAHPGVVGFVPAIANGAEGDVSPVKAQQGFAHAELTGRAIGAGAFDAFEAAGHHLTDDVDLTHAYREVVVPGAHTTAGDVCPVPVVGVPTIAGAEDGPSMFRGHFGVYEGRRKAVPEGCQGTKEPAFGSLTQWFVLGDRMPGPETMPRIGPFSVVALHPRDAGPKTEPLLVLGTVPGEPTTGVGFAIADRLAAELGSGAGVSPDHVAVVGLTNAYLGYFTTSAEYEMQAYEGGSTFYGPLQSLLAAEQLGALAGRVRDALRVRSTGAALRDGASRILEYRANDYEPGPVNHFFGTRTDCAAGEASWEAGSVERRGGNPIVSATFHYRGLEKSFFCSPPKIAVVCGGAPLVNRFGEAETDDGTRFEVRRARGEEWSATFFPTETEIGQQHCRFQVERHGAPPLVSGEFSL
ncbi:MAG TPA: neutral/alkaline non-lysosomal ceramidase N-terminal domain-containing protein [Polyangiaceae bacterium]|nr:neutral/alkaline non-lysosomal ceramidase N-terminal domain-containing protein [Polyangiaceae bacterium]